MGTRAEKTPNGFRLDGPKMWISNAPIADVFVVWAKSAAHGNRSAASFSKRNEGPVGAEDRRQALAARLHHRRDRDGRWGVPESALLPNVEGLKGPFGCLNRARYGISWGAWARPNCCMPPANTGSTASSSAGRWRRPTLPEEAGPYGDRYRPRLQALPASRTPDGRRPLGASPELISLPDEAQQLRRARTRCRPRWHATCTEANGISEEFQIMRHAANLETVNTYEGTHDVHALILGRAITGIQAFS